MKTKYRAIVCVCPVCGRVIGAEPHEHHGCKVVNKGLVPVVILTGGK